MYPPISALSRNLTARQDRASNDTDPEWTGLRGYEVTAMVVCFMVLAAIVMCYLTWRFRYKIVLRTAIKETTVVQNLVAVTLQEAVGIGEGYWSGNRAASAPFQPSSQNNLPITDDNQDLPLTNLERTGRQRRTSEPSERGVTTEIGEQTPAGRVRRSRETGRNGAPVSAAKRRESKGSKHRRPSMVLSAIKLSSGQSVPRRVDHRKISVGHRHHPLGWNIHGHGRRYSTPALRVSVEGEGELDGRESERSEQSKDDLPAVSKKYLQLEEERQEDEETIVEVKQSGDIEEFRS